MDPLSAISGIAGIATAGATLVSSLYTLVQTVRHAPRHMREVAKEMASLTCTLEHLHEIISDGHAVASRRYFHGIMSVVSNIKKTQDEILKMIEDQSIIRRLKWSKAKPLLADIHTHKSTVSMQVVILTLGIVKKDATHKMKSSQRRLRKQAECLVQDCKASLDSHDKRSYRDTGVPAPPSAPVPPDSNLQSPPVVSNLTTGFRTMPPAPHVEEPTDPEGEKEDALPIPSSTLKQEERKHTITPFDRNSHFDAAALLYDLVFAGASYISSGDTNGTQNGSKKEEQKDSGSLSDTEFEVFMSSSDEADYAIHRQHRVAERRARREQAEQEHSGQTHQDSPRPGLVVDHLLLQWTSLNMEEIKSGEEATPNDDEEVLRGKIRAIAREARALNEPIYDQDSYSSEDDEPPNIRYTGRRSSETNYRRRSPSPVRRRPTYRQSSFQQEQPEPRPHPHEYPPFPHSNGAYGSDFNTFYPPSAGRGYASHFGQPPFNGYQGPYGSHVPYPGQAYWSPPHMQPYWAPPPPPPRPVPNPSSHKFNKPTTLVLRPAYELNEGKDVSAPRLDVLNHDLHLVRQGGGGYPGMIWNADEFVERYGLDGTAVLGALVNDKSAAADTDLLHTFVNGHGLPMVYVRGSDLGETWFLEAKPVFVLFYHAAYKPQFFPTKAIGDNRDADRRKYVAIGEEWVRQEALDQLGIIPRERRDGRLILEPCITHAEMSELVRISSSLVWLQQRRKYARTFYTPLTTFRATHDAPPPPAILLEPKTDGGHTSAVGGASPVPSGPARETSPPPPPPPTIQIEEVATPTTGATPTLVESRHPYGRRRRRLRARTDAELREDKEDRRSQGGSDSGFGSLFSFAKGSLRKSKGDM